MTDRGKYQHQRADAGGSDIVTDDVAVCPVCGIEAPPEWGLFDYFDHLAYGHEGAGVRNPQQNQVRS